MQNNYNNNGIVCKKCIEIHTEEDGIVINDEWGYCKRCCQCTCAEEGYFCDCNVPDSMMVEGNAKYCKNCSISNNICAWCGKTMPNY